ncbi:MAG: hypothetical protein KDE27_18795 [Planctomycetes bacterium]|nr:hypothetical protein [Planctomycetota bacterium]
MRRCESLILFFALSAVPASAQTFVVDVNNGPGTNYTEIAAAVAAVPDGAVLEVRPGTYDPFQIRDKSLTVLGAPGVRIEAFDQTAIDIVDLAGDRSVTLRELTWSRLFGFAGDFVCRNNRGTVLIDRCVPGAFGGRLVVTDCDRAFVRDCDLASRALTTGALESYASNLVVTGTSIHGEWGALRQGGGRVQLTACTVETASGLAFGQAVIVLLGGGDLLMNGATSIATQLSTPGPAVAGDGTVALDPDTVVQGVASPAFDPNLTLESRATPRLEADTGPLGGTATAALDVPVAGTGVLFVGFAMTPVALPGLEDPLWLANPVRQAVGGAPLLTASYAVPNAPWVPGVQVAWRGAVLTGGGVVTLSNPVLYTHRP